MVWVEIAVSDRETVDRWPHIKRFLRRPDLDTESRAIVAETVERLDMDGRRPIGHLRKVG